MDIASKASLTDDSPEVPVELLKFLDQGTVECNPYRFQFELFERMGTAGVVIADKVKRVKGINDNVMQSMADAELH